MAEENKNDELRPEEIGKDFTINIMSEASDFHKKAIFKEIESLQNSLKEGATYIEFAGIN